MTARIRRAKELQALIESMQRDIQQFGGYTEDYKKLSGWRDELKTLDIHFDMEGKIIKAGDVVEHYAFVDYVTYNSEDAMCFKRDIGCLPINKHEVSKYGKVIGNVLVNPELYKRFINPLNNTK